MMSMHHPYGNTNTTGQNLYRTAVCPTFGVNYNQYFAAFHPNTNGLLPTPLMPRNSFPMPYDMNSNDFLTFIEQKTKPGSGLNPFANEFSLPKNNQLVPTTNTHERKLLFDDLIQKSLQSIDAIKKASKTVSVNHVSTQCHQSIDQINRSTQTTDDIDQYYLLEDYSSRAIKLMENYKYLFETNVQYSFRNIYDELYYLIISINQLITSMNRVNSIQSSSSDDRIRRMFSTTPSVLSRQIDPITSTRSKLCLLCQKPIDDNNEDTMHQFCRLLSSPPLT